MVEMKYKTLVVEPGSMAPVLILTDLGETRFFPIWGIGKFEAEAILLVVEDIKGARPGTHDLLKNAITELGGTLERVVIHSVDEKAGIYYARLELRQPGREAVIEVDARPSDSIALALRFGAPIFVSEAILASPEVVKDKEKVNKDIAEFKKFLSDVKPSDFERYDRSHGHDKPEDESGGDKGKK